MIAELRSHLIVDEGKAPITVERMLGRLRYAESLGLSVKQFRDGPEFAKLAGRDYLSTRRTTGATVHAYNNDVKLLNALARFSQYENVHFKKLREPRAQFKALTEDDVLTLLSYRSQERQADRFRRALLLWTLKSGMRPSEVAAMNVSDLDTENSRFHVRKPAKGGQRRWLPIEKWIWSTKRPFGAWLRNRPVPDGDTDALWTTTREGLQGNTTRHGPARRVTANYLRQVLARIGKEAGVKLSFTICRHTRATELRKRGWDLLYLQTYLGHAAITSTQVYAKVRAQELDGMMARKPGLDFFSSAFGAEE